MTRRVYNIVVDESGKPIEGVEVHVSLNKTTYKGTIEVARYGVLAKTDKRGYWEISLHANDTLDDPNSFYTVEEIKNGKRIATHYIRVPSSETYTEPIHIKQIETTPLPVTPPPNVVTGIAADNNQLLRGDVRLVGGSGIQLQQNNEAKTITIINTGGGGGGGGSGEPHNLLDGSVHPDTEATNVQRGMLVVGKLTGSGVKWSGLPIGLSGRFLKSNGIDVVWSVIDWTDIQNRPSTFPPSPHTHDAADIISGRLSPSRLPTSPNANRFLVVRTANSDPTYDTIQASDLPTHTHTPAQISPQGSGSGLDADTVDGQHASAFAPASHTHTRSQITDFAHASTHVAGGSDPLTGNLDANARVTVKQSGTVVGTRRAINFIAGSNISLSISDDAANEEVDVTISAAGGGSSSHNLLDGVVHPDTEATTVQRGMLIVGKLSGAVVKWGGLALGAAGRFLKSNGTDAVWDVIQASDLPNHTHTKAQITDLETITTTPTANAVPKADASGKIAVGWIPQGSGSNLDADKLDGLDSTAFERVSNKGVANGYAPLDANAKLPTTHLPSHASTHAAGGSDPITGNLDANARVAVQQGGTLVGTRRAINFIAGTNVSLNITDDSTNERVNVTINATGGGSGVGLDVYPKVLTPGSGWDDTTSSALWEMVTYTNTKQEVLRYPDNTAAQRWWEIVVLDAANFAGSFKIVWSSPVAAPSGGDAVVWEVAAGVINAGGSVDPSLTTATAIGSRNANEAANIQKETTVTLSLSGVQNGSRIIIRIRRLGADSNDTLAGDVRLHKVVID
jgi:hypothetical protein